VRSGIEMGVLPGGGSTLVYLAETMREEILAAMGDAEERAGADAVLKALKAPMAQIAFNAGLNGAATVERARAAGKFGYALNAATLQFEDLLEAGVLDSASVILNALTNSASIAALLLTTECVITERNPKSGMAQGM
jgi:chaperonin GroEL